MSYVTRYEAHQQEECREQYVKDCRIRTRASNQH